MSAASSILSLDDESISGSVKGRSQTEDFSRGPTRCFTEVTLPFNSVTGTGRREQSTKSATPRAHSKSKTHHSFGFKSFKWGSSSKKKGKKKSTFSFGRRKKRLPDTVESASPTSLSSEASVSATSISTLTVGRCDSGAGRTKSASVGSVAATTSKKSTLKPHVAVRKHKATKLRSSTELEVLRSLKQHVLNVVSTVAHSSKDKTLRDQIHRQLSEVWTLEYLILKEKLAKRQLGKSVTSSGSTVQSQAEATLKQFTERGVAFEDEDLQEAAKFILNGFFDPHQTVVHKQRAPSLRTAKKKPKRDSRMSPLHILRRAASRVLVTQIMMQKAGSSMSKELSTNPLVQKSLSRLGDWNWSPFELLDVAPIRGQIMTASVYRMLSNLDLIGALELSHRKVWSFLMEVENSYKQVPYHNSMHAADVANCMYSILQSSFFRCHMSVLDQFAAVIAAAVHDLGHDGFNNAFHQSVMSDRALTYNDTSILESYHISKAFFILKKSANNWFMKLTRPMKAYLRNAMIAMVLATDMNFHFREVSRLQQLLGCLKEAKAPSPPSASAMKALMSSELSLGSTLLSATRTASDSELTEEMSLSSMSSNPPMTTLSLGIPSLEATGSTPFARTPLQKTKAAHSRLSAGLPVDSRVTKTVTRFQVLADKIQPRVSGVDDEVTFMLSSAVHLCDISNPAKELKVCDQWADRVMSEWFVQGDLEKKRGLPVSPMMNRATASKPSGQIGFIKFIVRPLFEVFGSIVPEIAAHISQLDDNLEHWEFLRQAHKTVRVERRASLLKTGHVRSTSELAKRLDREARGGNHTPTAAKDSDDEKLDSSTGGIKTRTYFGVGRVERAAFKSAKKSDEQL